MEDETGGPRSLGFGTEPWIFGAQEVWDPKGRFQPLPMIVFVFLFFLPVLWGVLCKLVGRAPSNFVKQEPPNISGSYCRSPGEG